MYNIHINIHEYNKVVCSTGVYDHCAMEKVKFRALTMALTECWSFSCPRLPTLS